MKRMILAAVLAALPMFAQVTVPQPEPEHPKFFLALGAGFNEATDPHYSTTGTFGIHLGDGLYSTTSLDTSTKLNADTGKRVLFSTVRTGAQKIITRQGPITLMALGDVGAAVGGGNIVGAFSTGGTMTYSLPKSSHTFIYGSVRLIKSPNQDPNANPATVLTAFSFGIGRVF